MEPGRSAGPSSRPASAWRTRGPPRRPAARSWRFDRLEAELGGGDYLVGEGFSVADLTAASLLYPVVAPQEGPTLPEPTEGYERFIAPLRDRRGYRWVEEMFARHRKPGRSG